jgi:hypothetical protein
LQPKQQLDDAGGLRGAAVGRVVLAAGENEHDRPDDGGPNTYPTANAVPLVLAFGVTSIRMIAMTGITLTAAPSAYGRISPIALPIARHVAVHAGASSVVASG